MTINATEIARALGNGKETRLGDDGWKTVCPAHDDKAASLSVRDSRGKILIRCHAGCSQDQVIKALQDRDLWPKAKRKASWTPYSPVPDDVKVPSDLKHSRLGKPVRHWTYHDSKGRVIGYIYRFENSDGKTLLPLSYCKSDDGRFSWQWKSFDKPRPIYGLKELAERRDAKVLVFEGEKATDAARLIFTEHVCISWPGGAKAAKYVDWTPLAGRDVTLWPDADQPGQQCMETIAEILAAECANVAKLVALPEGLPKGWDVADEMPDDKQLDLMQLLRSSFVFEPGGDKAIAELNKRFAFVLIGGRGSILRETFDKEENKIEISYLTPEGFKQFYSNVFVQVGRKEIPLGNHWLSHEERRTYEDITFLPGKEVPNRYNLWRGYSVEPDPTGDWSTFREHLLENAASGNEEHFNWIMGWFAQMIQRPWEKVGTSLSFRGKQGTGKTIIGKIFGYLIQQHYTLVDDVRYVFGQFNSHMASTILFHSDEGFWGGDPKHVGRLRSMVTSDTQRIEFKGRDSVEVMNYMRLLITTNQNWVVPAASEERRFAVFDIGDGREQDRDYFIDMLRQMKSGGYSGLLHDLLNFDLKKVDIGKIPNTTALRDQKETSMSDVSKFWFSCLIDGEIFPGQSYGWPKEVYTHRFYEVFLENLDNWGVRYKPTSNEFFRDLAFCLPPGTGQRARRMTGGKKVWFFFPPDLEQARRYFDDLYNADFDWPDEDEVEPREAEPSRSGDLDLDSEIPF